MKNLGNCREISPVLQGDQCIHKSYSSPLAVHNPRNHGAHPQPSCKPAKIAKVLPPVSVISPPKTGGLSGGV